MIDTLLCIQKVFQKPVDILAQVVIIESVKENHLEKGKPKCVCRREGGRKEIYHGRGEQSAVLERRYIMKIIEEEVKSYTLVFEDRQGNGYSFPCDKQGNILWDECSYPEITKKSLAKARSEKWTGKNGEIVTLISRERYGICPRCGRRVYFGGSGWAAYMGTAECDCGQWYNVFGQALKPPEDWEENPWEDDWVVEDEEDY